MTNVLIIICHLVEIGGLFDLPKSGGGHAPTPDPTTLCMAKSAHTLRIVGILNKTTRSNTQNNALGIGGLQGQYKKIGTDIIFLHNSRRVCNTSEIFLSKVHLELR